VCFELFLCIYLAMPKIVKLFYVYTSELFDGGSLLISMEKPDLLQNYFRISCRSSMFSSSMSLLEENVCFLY